MSLKYYDPICVPMLEASHSAMLLNRNITFFMKLISKYVYDDHELFIQF